MSFRTTFLIIKPRWFWSDSSQRFITTGIPHRVRRSDIIKKWRKRNAISFTVLFLFVSGVFYLTIARVQQDKFEDLDDQGNPRE